jgi:hypothetical protein
VERGPVTQQSELRNPIHNRECGIVSKEQKKKQKTKKFQKNPNGAGSISTRKFHHPPRSRNKSKHPDPTKREGTTTLVFDACSRRRGIVGSGG